MEVNNFFWLKEAIKYLTNTGMDTRKQTSNICSVISEYNLIWYNYKNGKLTIVFKIKDNAFIILNTNIFACLVWNSNITSRKNMLGKRISFSVVLILWCQFILTTVLKPRLIDKRLSVSNLVEVQYFVDFTFFNYHIESCTSLDVGEITNR